MINAKEARKMSDKTSIIRVNRAKEWVISELSYLEDRIRRATDEGKYNTKYWWSKELLDETDITQEEARLALIDVFSDLGYSTAYCFNYGEDKVFMLYINWEEEDNE